MTENSDRNAFVTGATGFLGRHLVEQLRAAGWQVHAMHRSDKGLQPLLDCGAIPVLGDIDDLPALIRNMPRDLDAVFHAAASTSLWRQQDDAQYRSNVIGTRNMVEAALATGAKRFIHTSSAAVFGDLAFPGPINESSPSNAADHWVGYIRTKWQSEQEVMAGVARGLDAVCINPTGIVGPYDAHNWSRLIRMLASGQLPGIPPGSGGFVHVSEVARAEITAVDAGRSGERYLLGGINASYAEFIQLAAARLGRPAPRVLPAWLLRGVAQWNQLLSYLSRREPDITPEGAHLVTTTAAFDSSKAQRELGFELRSLAEMVDDTMAWMRETGQLPAA